MAWRRFWKKEALERERERPPLDDAGQRRLAALERRRQAMLFDLQQSEQATQPDNPWQQRIALLTEALETVDADRAVLDGLPPEPYAPVPAIPITELVVRAQEPSEVSFTVGGERFQFGEEIDWAERGTQIARGELLARGGDPAAVVPAATPAALRAPLTEHLAQSLFVFATGVRDRALDGDALPEAPTLADLARPCPDCGGWQDWRGRCQACMRRAAERQALNLEADRLLRERAREADEQRRLADRLVVARRRLSDVEAEIEGIRETSSSPLPSSRPGRGE